MARKMKVAQPRGVRTDRGGGWVDDGEGGVYVDYQVYTRYMRNRHTAQMPIASSTSQVSAVIVTLAQPTWTVRVDWTVKKKGAEPKVPNFELAEADLFTLMDDVQPHLLQLVGSGDVLAYRLSGRYLYAATTTGPDSYAYPAPPYINKKFVKGVAVNSDSFIDVTRLGQQARPNLKSPRTNIKG